MLRMTLKGMLAHKWRLASIFLSVVLGVAFLAGTLVLGDTIRRTFDNLFEDVFANTDATVRSASEVEGEFGSSVRARLDKSIVDEVRQVDGVAEADPSVQGYAQIVDKDGDPIGNPGMGAPTFGTNWTDVKAFNPFVLEPGGKGPTRNNEVVIDKLSADRGDYVVGDTVTVLVQAGPREFTLTGIAKFGDADSPGGASFALFTLPVAQELVGQAGKVDSVSVVGDPDLSQTELAERIQAAMPDGVEVLTGDQITTENQDSLKQGLGFITYFLLIFALVALVVGSFSIYNAFSIIVAQRTREMALLRTLGASRGQVMRSVLGEALAVGVLASLAGLIVGVFMASILKAVMAAFGFDIPGGGVVLKPPTIIWSFVIGIGVTLISAIAPGRKASKVPPIAALREAAIDSSAGSTIRMVVGLVVLGLGVAAVLSAVLGTAGGAQAGLGVFLVLIGFIVLGPVLARPISRFVGAPLPRLRGITGGLARENAMRNPKRTAGTARALMIGVGIVSLITVFASSIKASINDQIDRAFRGDFVIDSGSFGFGGLSTSLADDLNELDEVETATGVRFGQAEIDGNSRFLFVIDPRSFERIFDLEVTEGSLDDLGDDGIALFADTAEDGGWDVGDTIPARFAETGNTDLTLAAIYDGNEVAGNYVIGIDMWAANSAEQYDAQVYVQLAEGVSLDEGRAAVDSVADKVPNANVQDQDEFKRSISASIDPLIYLVYALLALALFIAFVGIANTLALSVYERTRELGLLRAVGMTKRQLRASVRWEAVLIALQGTLLGLILGTFFGWVLVRAAEGEGLTVFKLPITQAAIFVMIAALLSVGAAILPARRAARLDVLQAIASE